PQARMLGCRRREPATAEDTPEEILAHALCPPPEVMDGHAARVRRLLPASRKAPSAGRRWWDVEFFPLRAGKGIRGILGRVIPAAVVEPVAHVPVPEKIADLREQNA